jgi:hypothetical protein
MSYFGSLAKEAGNSFEMSGSIEPIEAGTHLLAVMDEAHWQDGRAGGPDYVEVRWNVLQPQQYANRKVYQKVHIEDKDEKRREKHQRMLLTMDAIAGGKLAAAGERPTDAGLATLLNKPMMIRVDVWETDDGKRGNWVSKVGPAKETPPRAPEAIEADVPF